MNNETIKSPFEEITLTPAQKEAWMKDKSEKFLKKLAELEDEFGIAIAPFINFHPLQGIKVGMTFIKKENKKEKNE
jgi:hypothetical protein